ncbi:MAG TPA: AAA family ATPase [Solirubrobacteraceae bacterium]|nr:AAA family ATPase [Solirubrobacteraceae bacterium]
MDTGGGEPGTRDGLLEREDARERLCDLIAAAGRGRGSVAAIVGGPGEGKTALLGEAAELGEEMGFRVVRAYGSTLERPFAFGVARQLLVPVVGDLAEEQRQAALSGPARPAGAVLDLGERAEALDAFSARHGLYWLLVNVAGERPMMLVVDDAHWADAPSLHWLASLHRRLDDLPVLVVVATRPPAFDGTGDALAVLLSDSGLPLIQVAPLSARAVGALAQRELADPVDTSFSEACHRATGGNPLAVIELLRELRRDGGAPASPDRLGDRAPATIARHVRGRLDQLGREAVALSQALAVLGERVPLRLAAALGGVEMEDAGRLVDELVVAGIVAPGHPLRFEHPLIQAAVRDTIPEGRRATLHARAARLLAAEARDPEEVAAHLLEAQPAGSADNVGLLREASAAARRRGAPQSALAYLERALAEPPAPEVRQALFAELSLAAWTAMDTNSLDRVEAARELTADPSERVRLDLMLAEMCHYAGRREQLFAALDRALGDAERTSPTMVLALRAARTAALTGLDSGWPAAEQPAHEALVSEAGPDTRLGRELRLNIALAGVSRGTVNAPETVAAVEDALSEELLESQEVGTVTATAHGLFALTWSGRFERAAELAERMMAEATAHGPVGKFGLALHVHAMAQLGRGALPSAEASGRLCLEVVERTATAFAEPVVRSTLGMVLVERGRLEEAHDVITAVAPDPSLPATGFYLRPALVALHRARGERAAALEQLAAIGEEYPAEGWRNPIFLPWRSELAALIAGEDPAEARELAEAELADARRCQVPRAIGTALRGRARAEVGETRERTLVEAVRTLEPSGARLELVRALIELGAHRRRDGRRAAAREPLRRALELAHQCGAEPLIALAGDELRAADGRPRRPWLSGPASLTPTELRVARLAASGASNQQIAESLFVAVKTVEMHLTHAYRKLGARARGELPSLLAGEGEAA